VGGQQVRCQLGLPAAADLLLELDHTARAEREAAPAEHQQRHEYFVRLPCLMGGVEPVDRFIEFDFNEQPQRGDADNRDNEQVDAALA